MQTTGFKSSASSKLGDRLFGGLAISFAWLTLILLAGIIIALVYASWPSIQAFGIGFLFSDAWNPPMEDFGGLIPIYGTIVTSVIALAIAGGPGFYRGFGLERLFRSSKSGDGDDVPREEAPRRIAPDEQLGASYPL